MRKRRTSWVQCSNGIPLAHACAVETRVRFSQPYTLLSPHPLLNWPPSCPPQTQRPRLRPTASFGSPPSPPESSSALPPSIPLDPAAADSAMQVIDGFQVQHFAANRTKLRAEVARLQAREDAASTIQRALWRTPRESMVAARVSRSASLIQGMWRLRSRRRRAGLRLVRAWRARARARVATLNRALLEAAEEGDLRAVAFMLRPPTATGAVPGLGLSVGVGGADANATAGSAKETALHAAASSGGGKGEEGNRNLPAKRRKRSSVSGRKGSSTSPWTVRAPRRSSGNTSTHGSVDAHGQRSAIKNWLKGRGCSPDWVGVIRALVRAGAMIEARDGRGYTPMMTATEEGSKETVSALAALGGEVDAMEARGGKRTPLVIAAQTAVSCRNICPSTKPFVHIAINHDSHRFQLERDRASFIRVRFDKRRKLCVLCIRSQKLELQHVHYPGKSCSRTCMHDLTREEASNPLSVTTCHPGERCNTECSSSGRSVGVRRESQPHHRGRFDTSPRGRWRRKYRSCGDVGSRRG